MSRARSTARRCAVQAIYQWQMTGQDANEICQQFLADGNMGKADLLYFEELVNQVVANSQGLDKAIVPVLDRPIDEVDPVERAILRIGVYELIHHAEIPFRVIINEAVEQAKTFGSDNGHKYVNGILDKLARTLRNSETEKPRQGIVK